MNYIKLKNTSLTILLVFCLLLSIFINKNFALTSPYTLPQQGVKASLFQEAENHFKAAQNAQAKFLSPKNYQKAMEHYTKAEKDYKKEKNLDDIRKELKAAVSYFQIAIETTELAKRILVSMLKARSDALKSKSPEFSMELWGKGENKLKDAAEKLEASHKDDAIKKAGEAETFFRQAELKAIKALYLNNTRELLKTAEKQDVEDEAPFTLEKAKKLIEDTEKELNENRYDNDKPRSLAKSAQYEAKHAIYLSNTIKQLQEDGKEFEDILLMAEEPLIQIADIIDVVAEFDEGSLKTTKLIVNYIETMQQNNENLTQTITNYQQIIKNNEDRISELETQIGNVVKIKSVLSQRIEKQEKIREQFASIQLMFMNNEAKIFRKGDDVIIRLVGLNFSVNKSIIEPKYFSLLTKVQNAIKTFPGCSITIEGHTDSHGSDKMNLELSKDRAESIQSYLIANLKLNSSDMEAVGYGETSPIANNETATGRTKNRRIDLVIHPEF